MESTFLFIVFTALLQSFCAGQEIAKQQVAKEGDNVMMTWNFTVQGGDTVLRDGNIQIVKVTLSGDVEIPFALRQGIQATVGTGMSRLTVTLLNVNVSHAGVYTYTRGVEQPLQKQLLIIQVKPDKPKIVPDSEPFVVGKQKKFTCNSTSNSQPSNHSLPLTFTWSVTPPGGRRDGDSYAITVPAQDRNTTFNFSCQAKEGEVESEYSETLSLLPIYRPLDVVVTSNPAASSQGEVEVKEGQPMTLTCSADCRPGCRVQWKDRRMGVVADSQTYSVASTGRSHFGAYQCIVNNTFGNVTKNLNVDVQYEALITIMKVNNRTIADRDSSFAVAENSSVKFEFMVDSNPAPSAQRSLKDWGSAEYGALTAITLSGPVEQSVEDRHQHFYSGHWSIVKAACSDTKDYIVEARNSFQTNVGSQARVNLSVNCSPRPDTPPRDFGVALGAHQTVEINITAFPRDLKFSLHLDNAAVRPQPQLKRHLLPEPWRMTVSFNVTIKNQNDYGMYKARFNNAHGDMNVSFSVRARGKPSPVELLNVTTVTSSAVTLTWQHGFDGGLPQKFTVDFRPHDSQEWKTAVANFIGGITTVENLQPDTTYHFRVHAHNELGRSESVEVEARTTAPDSGNGTIIGIAVGISVFVILLVAIPIIYRKFGKKSGDKEKDAQEHLMENQAAPVAGSSQDEYAEVKKPKKKKKDEEAAAPLYGVVNKPKKQKADEAAAPLYGVVNKPRKQDPDDVYENSDALRAAREKAKQNGDKAGPSVDASALPDSRHMNDEGLIYVDVELTTPAGNAGKKPRVKVKDTSSSNNNSNSKEPDTEYVMIDFSKRAPVIPESDEEEEETKKKEGK